ncbi:MAG TPA: hypothetical protein VER76_12650 [Pyrinomonadaceae bacterium]|nr:hypothetical protein [Pyrinomonadaceae bacterium]
MFHFTRAASLALCVTTLSLVAFAQSNDPLSSTQQKFKHKLKIVSKYNASSDTTAISFFLKQPNGLARLAGSPVAGTEFGEDVGIAVSFSYPGRQLAHAVDEASLWIAYTGQPRAAVTGQLSALVDGQKLVLSRQVEASPTRVKDNRAGSLTLSVARARLTQLANASRVELVLPSGEHIKLSREQLIALADFTSRMSP